MKLASESVFKLVLCPKIALLDLYLFQIHKLGLQELSKKFIFHLHAIMMELYLLVDKYLYYHSMKPSG